MTLHTHARPRDVDAQAGCGLGGITRDVARALPVPDQPDFLWPLLVHYLPIFDIDMTSS